MQQVIGQDESKAKFDAFQYYSNDLLRLKTLFRSSVGDDADDELNALATVRDALRSAGLSLSWQSSMEKDGDVCVFEFKALK